jgi:hypothetical protein
MIKSLTFLLLLFSLLAEKAEAQDAGRKKSIKFKYAEKQSEVITTTIPSPIDFDAVYYSIFVDPVFQDTLYDYLRFFSEGQLFKSGDKQQLPTEADVKNENLEKGYHGYFYIEDNVLHMELYIDRYSDKEYYEATFNDRIITIYKTKTMRSNINMIASVRKDTTVYNKIPMTLPNDVKPNW